MAFSAQNITVGTTAVKLFHATGATTLILASAAGFWYGPTSSVTVGTSGTTNTTAVNSGLYPPDGGHHPLELQAGDEVWAITSSSADIAVVATY